MLEIKAVHIAEYAAVADGRLTIAGVFDKIDYSRTQPDSETPAGAVDRVPLQRLYLVLVAEASLADGLRHRIRLRILNGAGVPVGEAMPFAIDFTLNSFGRRLRANIVIQVNGLMLPGADDYVFEISLDEAALTVLGDTILTVADVTPTPRG